MRTPPASSQYEETSVWIRGCMARQWKMPGRISRTQRTLSRPGPSNRSSPGRPGPAAGFSTCDARWPGFREDLSVTAGFPSEPDGKLRMTKPKQASSLHSMTKTKTPHTSGHRSASAHEGSDRPGSASVFSNILCAVDGTRPSTAAVEMAASLAGPDGHLTLLAVTAVSGSGAYTAAAISPSRADVVLSNAKRIADDAGVSSSGVVDPGGPPVEVILERAYDHDLLAIGAPAISWLGGMITGGVATAALSRFATPMLFARRSFTGSLRGRQILVASDGEDGSDHIVELAGRLGQSEGAQVTLVNAPGAESRMNPRAIQAQVRALQLALPYAGEPCIEPGRARDVILDAAKDAKAALVVIGSRRLHGLHAFGSVSRRVVHDAHCSVLVIPHAQ